jgi:hypothetical protein
MANNDDIQLDLNQDQAGQVIQNVPTGAQTTLAFWVDQSKIPEFWGQKAKDTVTAIVFIRKIEDLARTNHWTDTATYANALSIYQFFNFQIHVSRDLGVSSHSRTQAFSDKDAPFEGPEYGNNNSLDLSDRYTSLILIIVTFTHFIRFQTFTLLW